MPPRTVFKKEDVLNVAYAIVKKEGFEGKRTIPFRSCAGGKAGTGCDGGILSWE